MNTGQGAEVLLILGLGIAGAAIGFAWIRRITRDPEDHPSSWRSQMYGSPRAVLPGPVGHPPLEGGRGLRGRGQARLMLFAAILITAGPILLILVAPPTMAGGGPLALPTTWLGMAGYGFGLISMIRIYRADPEGGPSSWRGFRDR